MRSSQCVCVFVCAVRSAGGGRNGKRKRRKIGGPSWATCRSCRVQALAPVPPSLQHSRSKASQWNGLSFGKGYEPQFSRIQGSGADMSTSTNRERNSRVRTRATAEKVGAPTQSKTLSSARTDSHDRGHQWLVIAIKCTGICCAGRQQWYWLANQAESKSTITDSVTDREICCLNRGRHGARRRKVTPRARNASTAPTGARA